MTNKTPIIGKLHHHGSCILSKRLHVDFANFSVRSTTRLAIFIRIRSPRRGVSRAGCNRPVQPELGMNTLVCSSIVFKPSPLRAWQPVALGHQRRPYLAE